MSQFETHLLAEDPVVVLIGNNTPLRSQMAQTLNAQNLQVVIVDSKEIIKGNLNPKIFINVYKIIWLYENDQDHENYSKILKIIKEIDIQIVIVACLISKIETFNSDILYNWSIRAKEQEQFIIDSNYYLPKTNFVFGLEVMSQGVRNTSLEFLTSKIRKGIIVDLDLKFNLVDSKEFIETVKEFLFLPGKQSSILIDNKKNESKRIINSLKKLYDSYYKTNLEVILDKVTFSEPIPFSVKNKTLNSDTQLNYSEIISLFGSPEETELKIVNKPVLTSNKKINFSSDTRPEEQIDKGSLIKKINENKEDFVNQQNDENLILRELINFKEPTNVDLDSEIQRIFKTTRTETKINRIKKIADKSDKISRKSGRKKIFFVFGLIVAGFSFGVIFLISIFYITQGLLKKEIINLLSKGVLEEENYIVENNNLKLITKIVSFQIGGYGRIFDSDIVSNAGFMVETSEGLELISQMLLEVNEASKNMFLQIFVGDSGKTSEMAQILDEKASKVYKRLSELQASLNLIDLNIKSSQKESLVLDYENKLNLIRNRIFIQQRIVSILPSLVGENSKKTYAVIFQNNQELRPTGGFIQAIALLNFEDGVLVSNNVYSVYELDKKIQGDTIPPSDVSKNLGEEKWYLRDSNWNPDFPVASKQISWFINKSLGVDVDGVIAINLFTVKDLLDAVGPIDLSEYNEVITSKNILERMEFHSEVILVDHSDNLDYSVILLERIVDKFINLNREKIPSLLSSLEKSINENQLLISVADENNQYVLHNLGWTGALVKPNCPAQLSLSNCKVDAVAQVEANIGVNKANYYLDRSINHEIYIDKSIAIHKRKIIFKNNAKSNSWPKGTYKSYQRFYIDKDSSLEKVSINGSELVEEQISQSNVGEFKEIGIRVDVPIQKEVIIEIDYSTPHSFDKGLSYVFFNKKQSGTLGDNFKVSLEYSKDIKPVLISPSAEVVGNKISFDENKDVSLFSVEFK